MELNLNFQIKRLALNSLPAANDRLSLRFANVIKGDDGLTPLIGENGNWWIGDRDTGVAASGGSGSSSGEPGKSAYQAAIEGGYIGTEQEFNRELAKVRNKVDALVGKGLSTNDFTNEDKEILERLNEDGVDLSPILQALEQKAEKTDMYDRTTIDAKIETARIALNLTPEQLAALSVNLTPIQNEIKEVNLFSIRGKTMLVLGDSLSSASGGSMDAPAVGSWCKFVKEKLSLSAESRVIASGGATVTDKNGSTLQPLKSNWSGDNNVLSNQVYSVLDYKKRTPDYSPDIILIMAGTNNVNTSYPYTNWDGLLGDWDGQMYNYSLADSDYKLPDTSTPDGLARYERLREYRKKFYGAWRWMLETLLTTFPNAMIYVLAPLQNSNGRGQNMFTIYPHIRRVAEFYSLKYIDCAYESGLSFFANMRKDRGWDKQWYTFDGTHPDANGQRLIGNYVAQTIKGHYFEKGTISANKTDQNEEEIYYQITTQIANGDNGMGGTLDKYGTTSVLEGGSFVLKITPNQGYRINEIIVDGSAVAISNQITFSNVKANHTVVVDFAVDGGEVESVALHAISINGGASSCSSANVSIALSVSGLPTHYRIAELSAGVLSASWLVYTNPVNYTISGEGSKTLYIQVKDTVSESAVRSSTILYQKQGGETGGNRSVVSLNWGFAEKGFDAASGITKGYVVTSPKELYDTDGKQFGTIVFGGSTQLNYNANLAGKTTGDNSGVYPDWALERNICVASGNANGHLVLAVPSGIYRVKLLANISSASAWSGYASDPQDCVYTVNSITKVPTKIVDNTDTLIVFDNVIASDGVINVLFKTDTVNKRAVLNVIELEEM